MKVVISLGCSVIKRMRNIGFPVVMTQAIFVDKFDVFSKISVGDKLDWMEIWSHAGLLNSAKKTDKNYFTDIEDYFVYNKAWCNLTTNPTLKLCIECDERCSTIGFVFNSNLAKKIDEVLGEGGYEHIELLLEDQWHRDEMPIIGDRIDLWSMFPEIFLDSVDHKWSSAKFGQPLRAIFKDNIIQVVSRSFHWANHVELILDIVDKS